MGEFLDYLVYMAPALGRHTVEHLQMALTGVALAILAGVPAGIWISHNRKVAEWVLGFCNTIQTVPSLAFVGFMIPLTGLGRTTAIIILFFYSLLPIVRNTYTGITRVDPALVEAGRGMGMTGREILTMVQMPLALSVIVTGVRVATVISIGTTSIMSLAGAGGLGRLIFAGISQVNDRLVLVGALPAALLAVLADFLLARLERRLTPRGIRRDQPADALGSSQTLNQHVAGVS